MATTSFWGLDKGLDKNGKCSLFVGIKIRSVTREYLCSGDEFCGPCPDFSTCAKRQKDDRERIIKKLRASLSPA